MYCISAEMWGKDCTGIRLTPYSSDVHGCIVFALESSVREVYRWTMVTNRLSMRVDDKPGLWIGVLEHTWWYIRLRGPRCCGSIRYGGRIQGRECCVLLLLGGLAMRVLVYAWSLVREDGE